MKQGSHPALQAGKVAVITGGASGIGLATAQKLAERGMRVCLADCDEEALADAARSIEDAIAVPTDVSDRDSVQALASAVKSELGPVSVLMNHVGTAGARDPMRDLDRWHFVFQTNLFGTLHGIQAFLPAMVECGEPGVVINTSSKQGITTPPGDTSYNTSKAAVKVLTESLAHQLRNTEGCKVSAHLLIPGFTFSGGVRRHFAGKKPDFAWDCEQVADRLVEGLEADEFYILCEDNETTREMDEKRVYWAAHDLIENRPALSRWHPDWKDRFEAFMAEGPLRKD